VRRSRLALGLALAALAAALVGAIGPADDVRTTYTLPPGEPREPLLLAQREPESISVEVDCMLPEGRRLVFATTRSRESGGLFVTSDGEGLDVAVGEQQLERLPAGGECPFRIDLREGEVAEMPVVHELFWDQLQTPAVEITTRPHASDPTVVQWIAWALAALGAVAALALVAAPVRIGRPRLGRVHAADGVVGVVLLAWWILGPAFIDDGWVVARERTFATSGGFSNYYDTLGVNVPLGFWLEWAQHWLTESTSTLLVWRLPALACLAATWILGRWVLSRTLQRTDGVVLWALASAFLTCALAWGMTLRPEPAIALLAAAVLACTVRFLEAETAAPLAAAALLVPLALAGHHTGLVALAPLLAAAPVLFRWARSRLAAAGTILTASLAWLVVLAFVGADAAQRRDDAETFRAITSTTTSWRDEAVRYVRLSEFPNATPLRRASVALILLAVLAYLLRRRREGRSLLDLPATALGLGLLLLVATPSKWGWHFGALLGLAPVAVACETARLRSDAARARGWAGPLVVAGAAALAAAWIWTPRSAWQRGDLRVLDWIPAFESRLSLARLAFVLPLVLLAALVLVALARRRPPEAAAWRVAALTAPVLAVPAIAFTLAVLAADTAKADGWTLTRQNLDSLRGRSGCGLADDLLVDGSPLSERLAAAPALVHPELLTYFPCTTQPVLDDGVVEPPALMISPFEGTSWLRTWETSPFEGVLDLYRVRQLTVTSTTDPPPPELAVLEVGSGR
jgi:Mycobacterial cell wall arabinan synthesis protein